MLCSMLCNSASLAHTINYSARCGNKRPLCLLAPSHALLGLFMEGRPRLRTGLPGWCLWTWSLSPPPWPFLSQYGHSQGLNGEIFAYMGPGPGAGGPGPKGPGPMYAKISPVEPGGLARLLRRSLRPTPGWGNYGIHGPGGLGPGPPSPLAPGPGARAPSPGPGPGAAGPGAGPGPRAPGPMYAKIFP